MKILITSGGTDVPIDDVRKISNMSSGRYGAQIAAEFLQKREHVLFFNQKNSKHPYNYIDFSKFSGISDAELYLTEISFDDFYDYLDVIDHIQEYRPDVIISAAAVSDYVVQKRQGKISSDNDEMIIKLKKAPKILPLIREAAPDALLVGFKLLVGPSYKQSYDSVKKVFDSGVDLVVYNDLTEIRKGDYSRLVFKKDMTFEKADDASQLVNIITKRYYERILTLKVIDKVTDYGL